MLLRTVLLIGAGVAALAAAAPARADDWRDGGRWHHEDWRDHWRWGHDRPWAYPPPPPVYYAPPPVYYAPPPPPPPRYYGPPAAYFGFGWR